MKTSIERCSSCGKTYDFFTQQPNWPHESLQKTAEHSAVIDCSLPPTPDSIPIQDAAQEIVTYLVGLIGYQPSEYLYHEIQEILRRNFNVSE